jgi:hypothetical protein
VERLVLTDRTVITSWSEHAMHPGEFVHLVGFLERKSALLFLVRAPISNEMS